MKKDPLNGYLVFTKKEKRGTLFILAVIFLIFLSSKYIYPLIVKENFGDHSRLAALADSLKEIQSAEKERSGYKPQYGGKENYPSYSKREYDRPVAGELFYFDPNTLNEAGWQRLGLREKTIATIQNYVSKGGKFREPEDLRKIWGLREDEKERLIPYVRIAAAAAVSGRFTGSYSSNETKSYEKPIYEKKVTQAIDINTGDSSAYVSLPGIGPGFSKRIINFREKLGGFYKVEQVAETFGLPDSVFQKIKPLLKISGTEIRKININTATNEELKAHPYIRWQLANVITEYKKQHGNFKSSEDLKKIMILDPETIKKISPYLTY
ncbi:MAG: helix-hairpin-helix domain-containing protein [Ferruginibacter sp.]